MILYGRFVTGYILLYLCLYLYHAVNVQWLNTKVKMFSIICVVLFDVSPLCLNPATRALWGHKPPATELFVQQLIQARSKGKSHIAGPL